MNDNNFVNESHLFTQGKIITKTYTTTAREPSIYTKVTVIQLNLQCTLLVIASVTYSVLQRTTKNRDTKKVIPGFVHKTLLKEQKT